MKKSHFTKALKEFKEISTGAACYHDPVTDDFHCANDLSEEQAQEFGRKHHLQLQSWKAGQSCSEINCGAN